LSSSARTRQLAALIALAVGCLYAVPTFVELTLTKQHAAPWIVCVFLGDLVGCLFLFWLRFRRIACSIYLAAAAVKILLLSGPGVSAAALIWLTDLTPALCSIYILTVVMMRTTVSD
jgi:hypothetical protein